MKIEFAHISEPGPRPVNEDYVDCWVAQSGETIAVVADGLGGMGGGDIASKMAVVELRRQLDEFGLDEKSLVAAVGAAHRQIQKAQSTGNSSSRMATTLTAAVLTRDGILGVHCGDTRAVIARRRGIKRLTKDHSEGQRLFDAGKLTKEEFARYERKHILESALGDRNEPTIDVFKFDLMSGDHVLLTTDGVHNHVLLRELQNLSATSETPSALVERVAGAVEKYGPSDNYSMIALFAD